MMYICFYYFQEFIIIIKVVFFFDLFLLFFFLTDIEWKIIFIDTIKSINKLKFEKISKKYVYCNVQEEFINLLILRIYKRECHISLYIKSLII